MNKDDIKKTLKTCNPTYYNCKICPYKSVERCVDALNTDALNLITEQENEIERLRTTLGQCNTELNSALKSLKSQCREIGELRAENTRLKEKLKQVLLSIDTVKEMNTMYKIDEERKHAVQDFADKVKAKSYVNDYCREVVEIEKIDELLKEYEDDTL